MSSPSININYQNKDCAASTGGEVPCSHVPRLHCYELPLLADGQAPQHLTPILETRGDTYILRHRKNRYCLARVHSS